MLKANTAVETEFLLHAPKRHKEHAEGRTPRVAKIMALAIHLQQLVDNGQVENYTSLAYLGHVSRPRMTQIMNLTMLAPDIQEAILFLPKTISGRERLSERQLRKIAGEPLWETQRAKWSELLQK